MKNVINQIRKKRDISKDEIRQVDEILQMYRYYLESIKAEEIQTKRIIKSLEKKVGDKKLIITGKLSNT